MASEATLADLQLQMNQDQEVLGGWDAVMNLLESAVNEFFQSQWNAQTSSSGGKMEISGVWCEGIVPSPPSGQITVVTQYDIQLGSPLFQFQNGQDNVTVTQQILGGTLKQGSMSVQQSFQPASCGCQVNDGRVTWGSPVAIDTTQNPVLSGTVALAQVQGLVNSTTQSLILDFASGSFTVNNMTIKGVDNTQFVDEIKNWFNANNIKYILASVDFRNLASLPALTPTSFQFHVTTTNAGNTIVQLLITTDGSTPASAQINVDEPIPTADGLTCSLMISSRILFSDILANGFNASGNGFQLIPAVPGGPSPCWYAYINPEFVFAGSFSFGSCCDRTTVTYSIPLGGNFTGSSAGGFHLAQSENTQGNVQVNISVSADYPVTLSGIGASQVITITPGAPTVTVTGSAEEEIQSQLQSILNTDFVSAMSGIRFAPVTLFALENLVFPGNLIQMSQARVPGDLLIVGVFQTT